MSVIKLDNFWQIDVDINSVVLKYEEVTDVVNKETGKYVVKRDLFYYPTIDLALKAYTRKAINNCDSVLKILDKLQDLDSKIDKLFNNES